jgi:transglutaminase superfamily protein
MRELAKLRALTGAERRLLIVSCVATPIVAGGLSLFGFRRVHAAMARWPRPGRSGFAGVEAAWARARSASSVVAIAAGRGPVRATCLRRSLLLWWLLRWDGIDTILRVGVNRDGGSLHAHAWVEYMGRPLNDADDVAVRYPAFDRNFGAAPERVS